MICHDLQATFLPFCNYMTKCLVDFTFESLFNLFFPILSQVDVKFRFSQTIVPSAMANGRELRFNQIVPLQFRVQPPPISEFLPVRLQPATFIAGDEEHSPISAAYCIYNWPSNDQVVHITFLDMQPCISKYPLTSMDSTELYVSINKFKIYHRGISISH